MLELNRLLRPGGFFVWSATPVYWDNEEDVKIWKGSIFCIIEHIFHYTLKRLLHYLRKVFRYSFLLFLLFLMSSRLVS